METITFNWRLIILGAIAIAALAALAIWFFSGGKD
jgi:hypothetical protein